MWRPWKEIRTDVSVIAKGSRIYGPELKRCGACEREAKIRNPATHLVSVASTKGSVWHYTRILPPIETNQLAVTFCHRKFQYRELPQ